MIVKGLVESRQLLEGETIQDIAVIYERFDNSDYLCENNKFTERECEPEELVKVFRGDFETSSSLKNYKTYLIGNEFRDVDAVIHDLKVNHRNFFI